MVTEDAIVREALDGNFESRDQQERWLADHLRNAYTNGFIAGQETQHRKTWALAMQCAAKAATVWEAGDYITPDGKGYGNGRRDARAKIEQLSCPPIEATKDK